jgi:prefoldin subunit 1
MSTVNPSVDLELKKAFEELQVKMITNRNQVKAIDGQSEQLKRQIQHSKLTEAELSSLDQNTVRMFEGVGRMFVLSDKTRILNTLNEKAKLCEAKIVNLDKTKEYMEKNLKESENSLRELINVKKNKK